MVSSKTHQEIPDVDECIHETDPDFMLSGLKLSSIIRTTRLAVVSEDIFLGSIGEITSQRLETIKKKITHWILDS